MEFKIVTGYESIEADRPNEEGTMLIVVSDGVTSAPILLNNTERRQLIEWLERYTS